MSSRSRVASPRTVGINDLKSSNLANARISKKRSRGSTTWMEKRAQLHRLV